MQNCQIITIKYFKRTRFPIIHYIEKSQPNEYKKPPLVVGKRLKWQHRSRGSPNCGNVYRSETQEAVCCVLRLPHLCHLPDKYFRDTSRDIYLNIVMYLLHGFSGTPNDFLWNPVWVTLG